MVKIANTYNPVNSPPSANPLGTHYEITQPLLVDAEQLALDQKIVLGRLERWALQAVARNLLRDQRVAWCLRRIRADKSSDGVQIWKKGNSANYRNLILCSCVWVCPLCAAKISERRKLDLVNGVKTWTDRGGFVFMLTLTFPHYKNQRLGSLLSKFKKARRLFYNRKTWTKSFCGLLHRGRVRAMEVTHGKNGWHVHTHELLFLDGSPTTLHKAKLLKAWQSACVSAGLPEPNAHGLKLDNGERSAEYAGKWGVEHELTKAHQKTGNDQKGRTPWDLLRSVWENGSGSEEAQEDSELFIKFAKAFKGTKQLHWSKGLRNLLDLDEEQTDEEVNEQQEIEAELLGSLSPHQWQRVLSNNVRGHVLEVAREKGMPGVIQYIKELCVN